MFFKKRKTNYFILIIIFSGTIFIWSAIFSQVPDSVLELHFFSVGQGDAIFIETPSHKQILIDGGPDKSILEKLNQVMPFWDREIDLMILTHPDADHVTGLIEVLKYFKINHILFSGLDKETAVYREWQEMIKQKGIPLSLAQTGQKIIFPDQVVLEIFWPDQRIISNYFEPTNNVSVVGQLIYGASEILLTGDIEKKVETYLLTQNFNLESDVLKIAHHGSKTSTSNNFLEAVNPQIAVISVGENNRYQHPSQEILERLKNILVYRTDQLGDIEISTDGRLFRTRTEK
ncbi:MAG: ComEC/Rec2 family competence protein [Patescibacteria group bacterium]